MENYKCGYHNPETTSNFLQEHGGIEPCNLPCPLNPNETCYRWAICFMALKINEEKKK